MDVNVASMTVNQLRWEYSLPRWKYKNFDGSKSHFHESKKKNCRGKVYLHEREKPYVETFVEVKSKVN